MESNEVYLADLWRVILRSRWLVITLVILSTSIAIAYSLLATPYYRASVLMAVVSHDSEPGALGALTGQLGGVVSLAGIGQQGSGKREEYLAVLGSRQFAERFIRENDLLPVFFAEDWDASSGQWIAAEDAPTMEDAWELFDTEIRTVRVDADTGLVSLSIEWHDRELAARWANELVARINRELRERAIVDANKSLVFLYSELERTTVLGLQQGLYRLIEGKKQDEMLANVREQFAFKILDPATVPDADSEVRPKRVFLVIAGALLGGFLGLFIALLRGYVFKPEAPAT